jgi:hypothetical protein
MSHFRFNKLFIRFSPFLILLLALLACNLDEHLPTSPAVTAVLETAAGGQNVLPTPMPSYTAAATLQPEASGTPLPVETPAEEGAARHLL